MRDRIRQTYRAWSQKELSQRPVSRRTVLAAGIGAPLLVLAGSAWGFRRFLPGGEGYRPSAIIKASNELETAIDTLLSVAWVAKNAAQDDALMQQARGSLPPEDLKTLSLDEQSLTTLLDLFSEVRAVADSQIRANPSLSSSDFLAISAVPTISATGDYGRLDSQAVIPFSLSTYVLGWVGISQPLDIGVEFTGYAQDAGSSVKVTGLTRVG